MILDRMTKIVRNGKTDTAEALLARLNLAVAEMGGCRDKAESINRECDTILKELKKVEKFLEEDE
jgi:hypothetical protein